MRAMAMPTSQLVDRIGRLPDAEVWEHYPLAPWTSVRVGGPAELFIRPRTGAALIIERTT